MQSDAAVCLPTLPVELPEFSANPAPYLEAARREHPWLARFSQGYIIHGYQAAADLLADDTHMIFAGADIVEYYGLQGTMWGRFWQEGMSSPSKSEHDRVRAGVAHAFTPRHANQLRPLMRSVMTALLDEWAPRGAFDFAEFAAHYPVTVICGLLGISAEAIPNIRNALEDQFAVFELSPAVKALILPSWEVLWSFADGLIKDREASGEFDEEALLDALIAAKKAGQLDDTLLRFLVILLLEAGYDSSKNMLTLTMKTLIERPDIYARCATDKEFCGKVVQEALRQSSIAIGFRTVISDFTYQGFPFCKGDRLAIPLSLPGRDPTVFADPLTFDPERENARRHVAFGRGGHMCLGQYIARAQLEEGLHLIAQRLLSPRLADKITWRPIIGIWGLETLPIVFDAAHQNDTTRPT
jgi:cytochrome P450